MKTSHLILAETSQVFQESIQDMQKMPEFFNDAINWGIDASYAAFGFIVLLSLAVKLFDRK